MADKTNTRRKPVAARGKRSGAIANRGVHGEGNYQASREYNEATRDFVKSGRVEEAARRAAPASAREQASLEERRTRGKASREGRGSPAREAPRAPLAARRAGGPARGG